MSDELLYNKIYEKTKECGRDQFIKLLMQKERENQELKNQQKEFINFLNNMIIAYKRAEKEYGNVADRAFWIAFETALSKYKEIIGDKYE